MHRLHQALELRQSAEVWLEGFRRRPAFHRRSVCEGCADQAKARQLKPVYECSLGTTYSPQGAVLAAGVKSPADWAPMAEYLAVDEFRRGGAYLEESDYGSYCEFLTAWAAGGTRFEMTEFHSTEVGNALFQEIEERHYRGDTFIKKNVIAVYRFNADQKIVHLDIYEQAKDTGSWIIEAANKATE